MKFVDVKDEPRATQILHELLSERPQRSWISHQGLPTIEEHAAFVASHPFRYWYLIRGNILEPAESTGAVITHWVGALECTDRNEIGVSIFKRYQRQGFGTAALQEFMRLNEPLPAIPAIRNGKWLVNIGRHNDGSKQFFRKLGFAPIQETWVAHD